MEITGFKEEIYLRDMDFHGVALKIPYPIVWVVMNKGVIWGFEYKPLYHEYQGWCNIHGFANRPNIIFGYCDKMDKRDDEHSLMRVGDG